MITFAIKLLIKVLKYRRILCNGTKGNTARNQLHDIHANFSGGNVCLREKNLPLQIGPHYSIASPASKFRALPKQTSERFEGALIIISARLPARASEGKLLLNRFNKPSNVYACNMWKRSAAHWGFFNLRGMYWDKRKGEKFGVSYSFKLWWHKSCWNVSSKSFFANLKFISIVSLSRSYVRLTKLKF